MIANSSTSDQDLIECLTARQGGGRSLRHLRNGYAPDLSKKRVGHTGRRCVQLPDHQPHRDNYRWSIVINLMRAMLGWACAVALKDGT
jgi:hypothetical protein